MSIIGYIYIYIYMWTIKRDIEEYKRYAYGILTQKKAYDMLSREVMWWDLEKKQICIY